MKKITITLDRDDFHLEDERDFFCDHLLPSLYPGKSDIELDKIASIEITIIKSKINYG